MALRLSSGLLLAVVAALAVDQGFGAAFVDDAVAYPICAYVGALASVVVRRTDSTAWVASWRVRVPLSAAIAALALFALRTVGHYQLPFGTEAQTSGYWPYFALPSVVLAALVVVEGLIQWHQRRAAAMAVSRAV